MRCWTRGTPTGEFCIANREKKVTSSQSQAALFFLLKFSRPCIERNNSNESNFMTIRRCKEVISWSIYGHKVKMNMGQQNNYEGFNWWKGRDVLLG